MRKHNSFNLYHMSHFGNRCCTEQVLQYLLKEKIISPENPCGLFIDKNVLEENIKEFLPLLKLGIYSFYLVMLIKNIIFMYLSQRKYHFIKIQLDSDNICKDYGITAV